MSFAPVPATAAWHHRGARSGFEVAYFQADGDRCRIEGQAAAIEDGVPWAVEYAIEVDAAGATRRRRWRPKARAGPVQADPAQRRELEAMLDAGPGRLGLGGPTTDPPAGVSLCGSRQTASHQMTRALRPDKRISPLIAWLVQSTPRSR